MLTKTVNVINEESDVAEAFEAFFIGRAKLHFSINTSSRSLCRKTRTLQRNYLKIPFSNNLYPPPLATFIRVTAATH